MWHGLIIFAPYTSLVKSILQTFLLAAALSCLLISCGASRKTARHNVETPARPYQPLSEKALQKKYAAKLQASPGELDNTRLYYFIDEWYGTPYRYGGNTRSGVDCSGFVVQLYTKVFGSTLPRTAMQQFDASKKIKKTRKLEEGDLVFFNDGRGKVTHVGVYLMNNFFVHSGTGSGVIIGNLEDDYWREHFVAGGKRR